MFDKAYTSATMDYEIIFWGYTFAIKKITWFAQVEKEFVRGSISQAQGMVMSSPFTVCP